MRCRSAGSLGKLPVDGSNVLALGHEQAREILGEVAALGLIGQEVAKGTQRVLNDLRVVDDTGHGRLLVRTPYPPLVYKFRRRRQLRTDFARRQFYDKRITSAEVVEFLRQLLREHPRRHVVVVMDQAPPHTSKATAAFIAGQPRLHVFHLPAYSPDWNPDEKVWNHLKHQELKGHQAKTKEEIRELAEQKLTTMAQNAELLRGTYFRCCIADLLA